MRRRWLSSQTIFPCGVSRAIPLDLRPPTVHPRLRTPPPLHPARAPSNSLCEPCIPGCALSLLPSCACPPSNSCTEEAAWGVRRRAIHFPIHAALTPPSPPYHTLHYACPGPTPHLYTHADKENTPTSTTNSQKRFFGGSDAEQVTAHTTLAAQHARPNTTPPLDGRLPAHACACSPSSHTYTPTLLFAIPRWQRRPFAPLSPLTHSFP